jgi:hypothetical protein
MIQVENNEPTKDEFQIQNVGSGLTWETLSETPPLSIPWDGNDSPRQEILTGHTERAVIVELIHGQEFGFWMDGIEEYDKRCEVVAGWWDVVDGRLDARKYTRLDDFKPGLYYLVLRITGAKANRSLVAGVKITWFGRTEDNPIPREHNFALGRPRVELQFFDPPPPWGAAERELLTPSATHTGERYPRPGES